MCISHKICYYSDPMHLSVIIPAYNEAKRLPQTLQRIQQYLHTMQLPAEVIVVDDGSTDQTTQVVTDLKLPNVRILTQPSNRGKFAAFRAGVAAAAGQWVLLYDADGATPIAVLDKFWPLTEQGYDALIGSRRVHEANITVQQSLPRQLFGRLAYLTIRTLTGVALKDTQCGFKLCRATLAKQVATQMQVQRFAGDVEFIYLVQYCGGRLKEVAVEWHDVPVSTVRWGDYWHSLVDTLKIRRNIRRGFYHR